MILFVEKRFYRYFFILEILVQLESKSVADTLAKE